MLKVGITGGMGSGKSTVCRLFAMLGIPVYDSDLRAKELMVTNQVVMAAIIALFGAESYSDASDRPMLNRSHISEKVFSDAALLAQLNGIVHPAVFADLDRWCALQNSPYVLIESAILHQSGLADRVDKIIFVDAPVEVRVERAIRRDDTAREKIVQRIASQYLGGCSDFVIDNGGLRLVWPQVLEIDKVLRS